LRPVLPPLPLPREALGVSIRQEEFTINKSITKFEAIADNEQPSWDHGVGHNLVFHAIVCSRGEYL
jgi:hypothetical protein